MIQTPLGACITVRVKLIPLSAATAPFLADARGLCAEELLVQMVLDPGAPRTRGSLLHTAPLRPCPCVLRAAQPWARSLLAPAPSLLPAALAQPFTAVCALRFQSGMVGHRRCHVVPDDLQ